MFNEMIERIQTNTVAMLLKVRVEVRQQPAQRVMPTISPAQPQPQSAETPARPAPEAPTAAPAPSPAVPSSPQSLRGVDTQGMQIPKAVDVDSLKTSGSSKFNPASMPKQKKIGPNDPCPCGSGLKYKKCHGKPY